jgi:hypothetical protein
LTKRRSRHQHRLLRNLRQRARAHRHRQPHSAARPTQGIYPVRSLPPPHLPARRHPDEIKN